MFTDRIHRLPRIWSNSLLKVICAELNGDIVNISAHKDEDKEGGVYADYFKSKDSYSITNFNTTSRGLTGRNDEIFLDLEAKLDPSLVQKFDVVFNHTTLEHIFEIDVAFYNLCSLSNDYIIVVVPFVQQYHADYGDYWRFSPLCLLRLAKKNGFVTSFLSWNDSIGSSCYVILVARRGDRIDSRLLALAENKLYLVNSLKERKGPGYMSTGLLNFIRQLF